MLPLDPDVCTFLEVNASQEEGRASDLRGLAVGILGKLTETSLSTTTLSICVVLSSITKQSSDCCRARVLLVGWAKDLYASAGPVDPPSVEVRLVDEPGYWAASKLGSCFPCFA